MAGCPIRRARERGVPDKDGDVVAFPFLPHVTGASKPPGWSRWSPVEKIEHLLGMSLDQAHDILSWPTDELDRRDDPISGPCTLT
jgi:hypothetical protein